MCAELETYETHQLQSCKTMDRDILFYSLLGFDIIKNFNYMNQVNIFYFIYFSHGIQITMKEKGAWHWCKVTSQFKMVACEKLLTKLTGNKL